MPAGTVFRSEGVTRVLGVATENVGATRDWWLDRVHPDDLPRLKTRLEKALAHESTFVAEYRVRHEDGHYVHIWDRGIVVRDARGAAIRVVGGDLDVSERIRAEEQIRRTNEMLSGLIKSSPLAIITIDGADGYSPGTRPPKKSSAGRSGRLSAAICPSFPRAGRLNSRGF